MGVWGVGPPAVDVLPAKEAEPYGMMASKLMPERAAPEALTCLEAAACCRKRARVSGFRARMATPGGRKVLAARRKKNRKVLVPASVPKRKM